MQSVKDLILKSMLHEYMILEHLHSRIPESSMEWRPQENMRSTRELLQYLSYIGSTITELMIKGGWSVPENVEKYRANAAASKTMAPETFLEKIHSEKAKVTELIEKLSEADLDREIGLILGRKGSLGQALINDTIKYLTAYRMQLFLYAKMNGAEIGTANNWNGIDRKS